MQKRVFRIIFLFILLFTGFGLHLFSLASAFVCTPEEMLDRAIEDFEKEQDGFRFKSWADVKLSDLDIFCRRDNQRRNTTRHYKSSTVSTCPEAYRPENRLAFHADGALHYLKAEYPPRPAYYNFVFHYRPF